MVQAIVIITCDIDGVLSDCTGRYEKLYQGREHPSWSPDWDQFHGPDMDCEPVHEEYVALIKLLQPAHRVILLTNRTEKLRERTVAWLRSNSISYNLLLMRGENQPFPEAKGIWLDYLMSLNHKPSLGIDDDPAERNTYEKRGIPFLYVHRGHHVGEIGALHESDGQRVGR